MGLSHSCLANSAGESSTLFKCKNPVIVMTTRQDGLQRTAKPLNNGVISK